MTFPSKSCMYKDACKTECWVMMHDYTLTTRIYMRARTRITFLCVGCVVSASVVLGCKWHFMPQKDYIPFPLRGRRSIWGGWAVMPVAVRIVNDVWYKRGINHGIPFAWQTQYLVRLESDACCNWHRKWHSICNAEPWDSWGLASAVFGDFRRWSLLVFALQIRIHLQCVWLNDFFFARQAQYFLKLEAALGESWFVSHGEVFCSTAAVLLCNTNRSRKNPEIAITCCCAFLVGRFHRSLVHAWLPPNSTNKTLSPGNLPENWALLSGYSCH